MQTGLDTDDLNQALDEEDEEEDDEEDDELNEMVQETIDNLEAYNVDNELANLQFVNDENLINDEISRFSAVDYLIGQSRSIIMTNNLNESINVNDHNSNQTSNETVTLNETIDQSVSLGQNLEQTSLSLNLSNIDHELTRPSDAEQRSRLSNGSLSNVQIDENYDNTSLVPRTLNEETTPLAKTGEPIALCKLRRRAVKILASRIRTEKEYYEDRENELKQRLDNLIIKNQELENQLNQTNQPHKQLFLISTAFVFCSLISYFIHTFN